MYKLSFYNSANYNSYSEARDAGAVHTTGSPLDMFANRTVFYDTLEIIHAQAKCLGAASTLVAGVVLEPQGLFVTLDHIREQWDKQDGSEVKL
jgi:hypothetical protein